MSRTSRTSSLTGLARAGFTELSVAEASLAELQTLIGMPREVWQDDVSVAADPDLALSALVQIARRDPASVRAMMEADEPRRAAWALLGSSSGFGEFFLRHPNWRRLRRPPESFRATASFARQCSRQLTREMALPRLVTSRRGSPCAFGTARCWRELQCSICSASDRPTSSPMLQHLSPTPRGRR